MATRARHEILVFCFRRSSPEDTGLRRCAPPPPGSREVIQTALRSSGLSFTQRRGWGWRASLPGPYLLRRFSKPNTTISWRARVAPGNAIKGGPGGKPPAPPAYLPLRVGHPALSRFALTSTYPRLVASDIFTERSRRRCKVAGLSMAANPAGSVRARSTARSIFCGSPPVLCASSFSTSPRPGRSPG